MTKTVNRWDGFSLEELKQISVDLLCEGENKKWRVNLVAQNLSDSIFSYLHEKLRNNHD